MGNGSDIILERPDGVLLEQSFKFAKANNNQVEYEVLIVGMLVAKKLGVRRLLAKSDSLLKTGHVSRDYQANDP